jgi:hypothetical protein
MPALPDVPGVLRVDMDYAVGSDATAMSRFYMAYHGTPPTAAFLASQATLFRASLTGSIGAIMHPDTSWTKTTITDLSSPTGAVGTDSTAVVGTRSGGPLPAAAAVLANFAIGRRYRGGKPRMYQPWGTDTDLLTRQEWLTASVTAFELSVESILIALEGDAGGGTNIDTSCSVSYYGPPNRIITGSTGRVRTVSTVRTVPLVDPVQASSVNVHVASQRRRNQIRA